MRATATDSALGAALLCAAVLASPAQATPALPAGAPAGGGAIRIAAEPAHLVLGTDAGAELRIQAPPGAAGLLVTASVGQVQDLRSLGSGAFTARYRSPAERFPQVAIVSAVARVGSRSIDGWIAIPLHGRGDARVRTQPNAVITLRIGEEQFGPKRADSSGLAAIPVVVPPGVREAYHGFRPIDLKLPEPQLVHVAVDRESVPADAPSELTVHAYVVTPHGTARAGDAPALEAGRGALGPVVAVSPGEFEATWRLPPGPAGPVSIGARLPHSHGSAAAARVEAIPGPPASVAVRFDRERIVAGDTGEVLVTARALDAAGNATAADLGMESDAGDLSKPTRSAEGWRSILRVPARFEGRDRIEVTAMTTEEGIVGSRSIPLVPGAPSSAALEPRRPLVAADGLGPVDLRLSVADRFGNRISGLEPSGTARRGVIERIAPSGPGEYVVRYRPPRGPAPAGDELEIAVASLTSRAIVDLVPDRPRVAIAPKLGLAGDVSHGVSPYVGAEAEPLPRRLPWGLSIAGEVGWFRYAQGPAELPAARGSCLLALGSIALRPEMTGRALAWVGVSAGAAIRSVESPGSSSSTHAAPALSASVGGGYRLRAGTPFAELRLVRVMTGPTAEADGFDAWVGTIGWRFEPGFGG